MSLKAPAIPRRSRLFPIEPIGVGTAYTESLTSYLNRLAQEHCLTSRTLIMREIAPQIMGQDFEVSYRKKKVSSLFANTDAKPALNGMKTMTQNLTQALEYLTQREDLKILSFLTWKRVISERELFRQYRAWCPDCYEQWKQEKKSIYEPLLWSFRDVKICLHHQCQLIDECPHCGSRLPVIANFLLPGFCSRCKEWMGRDKDGRKSTHPRDIEEIRSNITSIGELIAVVPQLKYEPTMEELIRKLQFISFVFESAVSKDLTRFVALGNIMEQLKIAVGQHQNKPFHLVKLIIPVCQRANLTLSQLFLEDIQWLSRILFEHFHLGYKV